MIILLHRVSAEIAGRDAVGKTADADVAAWEGPAFAEGEHREPGVGGRERQGEMSIGLKKGGYGSWRDGWSWIILGHTPHATHFPTASKEEKSSPENVLITITEHEPIPPILEHVQTQQHSVEVAPFVDYDLARFLFPFVAALDAEDVPVSFRSL